MQLAAGASGITVAKIGEAEVLPVDDVLIAYPIMADKLPRLRALADRRRGRVVVDSVEAARALPGIGALVEVDIGAARCGVTRPKTWWRLRVPAGTSGAVLLAVVARRGRASTGRARVDGHVAALEAAGFAVPIVSGGSTPGANKTRLIPATTEIRPGTYVFNDASCVANALSAIDDCALRVLVTVVSTAVAGQCLVDGGSKTFSSDSTVGAGTFGMFPDRPSGPCTR